MTSEIGAPPGSLRYFAVLFAPPSARPLLEALYGFDAEIRATVDATAHEAAHARLQWWRDELDRLSAGRPTHPLAIALQPLRTRTDVDLTLLHEALVAADLDLAGMTYRTWGELDAYCFRASGVLQTLAAAALAGDRALSDTERRFARELGSAQRQAEMIRDFQRDLGRGRLYAPLEAMDAAGLDPVQLHRAADTGSTAALLSRWRARVSATLKALPSTLRDRDERATQRHGLVLGALHEKLLERTAQSTATAGDRVEVAPWTRLWTAWRTAVRLG